MSNSRRPSPQELRLWKASQDSGWPLATQCAFHLDHALELVAFRHALDDTCRSLDAFRLALVTTGEIVDICERPVELDIDVLARPERLDAGEFVEALLVRDRDTQIELDAPALRVRIVDASGPRPLVAITASGVQADAASLLRFTQLLLEAYRARLESRTLRLESPRYSEAAEVFNELTEHADAGVARAFWAQRWAGCATSSARHRGARVYLRSALPLAVVRELQWLAAASGGGLSDALVACWLATTSRLARSNQSMVARIIGGRTHVQLRQMIGALSRCVPVAHRFDSGATLAQMIQQLKQQQADVLEWIDHYQRVPVDEAAANPRFIFDYNEFRAADLPMVGVSTLGLWSFAEPCDALLATSLRDEALEVLLAYDNERLSEPEAGALVRSWVRMVHAVCARPEVPLAFADITDAHGAPTQRTSVVSDAADATVQQRFERLVLDEPDAVALESDGLHLTYGELDQLANGFALRLVELGVTCDSRIAVVLPRSFELFVAILATWKCGAAYVPIDVEDPIERVGLIVEDCQPVVVVTTNVLKAKFESLRCEVHALELRELRPACNAPRARAAPGELAYVIYTSGSTGRPKGVMVTHGGLASYVGWALEAYGGLSSLLHSSVSFDLAVTALFLPLVAGERVILTGEGRGLVAAVRALENNRTPLLLKVTPSQLALLTAVGGANATYPCVKVLVVGGEALNAAPIKPWAACHPQCRIVNEYGPTETVVGCTAHFIENPSALQGSVPIGVPIQDARIYILDKHLMPVPPGIIGEVFVGGPVVARGYLGLPRHTAARFVPDPFSDIAGARMYRTGDLARELAGGALDFIGREDEQVKINGVRVELAEIEAVVMALPGVVQCAVTRHVDSMGAAALAAYITLREGLSPSPETARQLREDARARLPAAMVPRFFIALQELPLAPGGKIDKSALPSPENSSLESAPEAVGLIEETLAAVLCSVLALDTLRVDDNYFVVGGDSIRAIQVVALLRERGIELTVAELFANPTIKELVRALSARTELPPLVANSQPFGLLTEGDFARVAGLALQDAFPLSKLQAGMLYHRSVAPTSSVYHDIFSYRIAAPVDIRLLRAAADGLTRSHPALRSSFLLEGVDEALQLVHAEPVSLLSVEDISELSASEQDARVREWIASDKARGFDVTRPPLLRLHVHVRGKSELQLSMSFHHSLLDGWSDALLLTELFGRYFSLLEDGPPPSQAMRVVQRDYLEFERAAIASSQCRAFWATQLERAEKLEICDLSAAAFGATRVESRLVTIAQDTARGLRRVAHRQALPLKTVLLAAHLRVMSALGAGRDVTTCVVSNGRPEMEGADRAVGLFINTLPFRLRLNGGTWLELLRATFDADLRTLPHRWFPYSEIVRQHGSVSDVLFYFTDYYIFSPMVKSGRLEVLETIAWEQTSFPLVANFGVDPATGEPRLTLIWQPERISGARIGQVEHAYQAAFAQIARDPECRYDNTALLPASALERTSAWGKGPTRRGGDQLVHELIAARVALDPQALAVCMGDRFITYAELDSRSSAIASGLVRLGATNETVVAVALERDLDLPIALLGVLKVGAAFVGLDMGQPQSRLDTLIDDARPTIVIGNRPPAHWTARGITVVSPDALSVSAPSRGGTRIDPENLAYINYTSGSTGIPNGVLVTHRSLLNAVRSFAHRLEIGHGDRLLAVSSIAFDISLLEIFLPLVTGATLVMTTEDVVRDPVLLARELSVQSITVMQATPALWSLLVNEEWCAQRPLLALCGGEALPLALAERLRPKVGTLWNVYGPTETTIWSTAGEIARVEQPIALGEPLDNTNLYVLDAFLEPVCAGVAGELYIGGEGLARGYLGRARETAARFVPDPFSGRPNSRMFRTGDRVRYTQDGKLEFLGRVDRQLKIRGYRVEPGEVEEILLEFDCVRACAVDAVAGASGITLRAHVVLSDEGSIGAVREHARARLPSYMIPHRFEETTALPLTVSGKVDRRALAARPLDVALDEDAGPCNALEEIVLDRVLIYATAPRAGVLANLMLLGIDSLKMVRLHGEICKLLGSSLPLYAFFEHSNVRELCVQITTLDAGALRRAEAIMNLVTLPESELGAALEQLRADFEDTTSANEKRG